MLTKLRLRSFPLDQSEHVLDELESENLLSDLRFTEVFIHQRFERGSGPVKIRAELYERGISKSLVSRFIANDEYDWFESVVLVRHKRFGAERPSSYEERAKQSRFLSGRGFTPEHIKYALES